MKNKAKFLIKQSIKKKMDTKWFKIVNVILLILMVALFNIDSIINAFGGDFEKPRKVYVYDTLGVYDLFNANFNESSKTFTNLSKFEVTKLSTSNDLESKKSELSSDEDNIIIEITPNTDNIMDAKITTYDSLGTLTDTLITTSLNSTKQAIALETSGIDTEVLEKSLSSINISKELTNTKATGTGDAKDLMSAGVLMVFLIPFFILIVLLVQMIGAEINDEKTTKSMEIIISNVSPKVHFATKIVASTTFVLTQTILIFLYGLIAFGVRMIFGSGLSLDTTTSVGLDISQMLTMLKNSGIINSLLKGLPFFLVLIIGSFLAYALLAGILASMTTSIEDFQQLQSPLMFLLMAGYYIGIMASFFQGSLFIRIVGYIPFISVLVCPITYILGQTTLIDLGISCVLLLFVCYLLFKYGIRVYKVGILNYSSKDLWKKVFKSLKKESV